MVKPLESFMDERLNFLRNELEESEEQINEYEKRLEYHKAEIVRIREQINRIEELGF